MSEIPPKGQAPRAAGEQPVMPPDQSQRDAAQPERTRPVEPSRMPGASPSPPPRLPAGQQPHQPPRSRRRRTDRASAAPPPIYAPQVQGQYGRPLPRPAGQRGVRPSESGLYLPWWSLVVMIAVVWLAAFGLLYAVSGLTEPNTPGNQPPRVQVMTAQPTLSQDFAAGNSAGVPQPNAGTYPTTIPQALPTPTVTLPTPIPSPSLPPGEFVIGAAVQVIGVETSGLNVRDTPGRDGLPRFLAYDDDTFVLVDGPQAADGFEWWRIEDPNDPTRYGWAARNYLMVTSP